MKNLLVFSMFLSCSLLAMEPKEMDERKINEKIEKIHCLMYSNPELAAVEAAALALGKSPKEIRGLQGLHESNITKIIYREECNYKTYIANLDNGDYICANYFVAGPMVGQYDCTRSVMNQKGCIVEVPLPNGYYHDLEKLYKKSLNK